MSVDPKILSIYFLRELPDATESDVIQYANTQFPDRPTVISQFVSDWRSLRERWLDAQHASSER